MAALNSFCCRAQKVLKETEKNREITKIKRKKNAKDQQTLHEYCRQSHRN